MKENKRIFILCGVIGAFLLLILIVSVSSSGLSELESKIYNATKSELSSFKDPSSVKIQEVQICGDYAKAKAETIKEKMIRKAMSNKRKSIKERLISDTETIPKWLTEGLKAVTLAPSARNSQKAMFEYKNGIVFAKVHNDYEFDLVDLGIAKKHFELVANGKFEFGNGKPFTLN